MPMQPITGPNLPVGGRPYSPAVRVDNYIYVSGQASVDARGEIVPDTFAGEMHRSMANVKAVLKAANVELRHVFQVRGYVARQEDIPEYNRLYREYFSEPFPVRTTLIGCLGTMLKFEIDVVAYCDDRRDT